MPGVELIPEDRRSFWANVIRSAVASPPERFARQNGAAVAAFAEAASVITHSDSLEDALQMAVSCGNHTDTIAAIAGAHLGAVSGASAVPARLRQQVHRWPPGSVIGADGLEQLALQAAGLR